MDTCDKLPDYLEDGLDAVICGTAAGNRSAARRRYYAGRGNRFWKFLFLAGLTDRELTPDEDENLLLYGIGLTDLAKNISASDDTGLGGHFDIAGFLAKIETHRPTWVAFHGKRAAEEVSGSLGHGRTVDYGEQSWTIGESRVYVLPSASAANQDESRMKPKTSRLEWFSEFAELVKRLR